MSADDRHAALVALLAASPIGVGALCGWAWAAALVGTALIVSAVVVLVVRARGRRAMLRFLWSHLPRGRRALPAAARARAGDRA